jgi:hypothetical protein
MVCARCGPAATDRRRLTPECLAAMRDLSLAAEKGPARDVELTAAIVNELRAVLGQTVSYVLGRRPRLLGYVDGS